MQRGAHLRRYGLTTMLLRIPKQLMITMVLVSLVAAQQPYQPKFSGDPAHSDAEAAALGYMRTAVYAQKQYQKKHQKFAPSLASLAGSGSFTRRMINPERGDYTVGFRSRKNAMSYELSMTPRVFDAAHRAFWVNENGIIRAESEKPATAESPVLRPE